MGLVRSQVLLEESQVERLRAIAATEGRSLSEIVREMIDQQLRQRVYDEMSQAAGRLVKDYAPGGDLTDMTALDAEEFGDA